MSVPKIKEDEQLRLIFMATWNVLSTKLTFICKVIFTDWKRHITYCCISLSFVEFKRVICKKHRKHTPRKKVKFYLMRKWSKKLTSISSSNQVNQDTTRSAQQKPATKLSTSSDTHTHTLQTVQITPNLQLTLKVPPFFSLSLSLLNPCSSIYPLKCTSQPKLKQSQ